MKSFGILFAVVCVLLFVGAASAVVLPNATAETNSISSTTSVECTGIVMSSSDYSLEHSNQMLDGAPLQGGEMYGASTYSSQMIAMNGDTSFVKVANFNNENQLTNGKNVDVTTILTYDASTGGLATGSESIAQFNAGQAGQVLGDEMLCPFGDDDTQIISPFNTMTVMGSNFNVYNVDMTTVAGSTTTAATVDVPSSTSYVVDATGAGDITAYIDVFAQDARGDGTALVTPETSEYNVLFPASTKTVTTEGHFEYINRCLKWIPGTTTTVTTPEVGVTTVTPAVYTPTTPSANTWYHDSTTASGQFVFTKAMQFTSGIY